MSDAAKIALPGYETKANADAERERLSAEAAYVDKSEMVLDPSLLDKSLVDRMPQPTGWRLLVMPYRGKAKTEGGILLTSRTQEENQVAAVCAYLLKVGPLAYQDTKKFPTGAWAGEGDWVLFPRYAGTRFKLEDGEEIRIINDDEVLGTILHPDDIVSL